MACRFYVAPFGVRGKNGVPRKGGSVGHFSEHAVCVGEGPGFRIEIEEVVHQEDAQVKAVFDDSSVNGSSGECVFGFDCRLEKVDAYIGMRGRF